MPAFVGLELARFKVLLEEELHCGKTTYHIASRSRIGPRPPKSRAFVLDVKLVAYLLRIRRTNCCLPKKTQKVLPIRALPGVCAGRVAFTSAIGGTEPWSMEIVLAE